jgi:hypothetical protein
MAILNMIKGGRKAKKEMRQYESQHRQNLEESLANLNKKLARIQKLQVQNLQINLNTGMQVEDSKLYTGNNYKTYEQAINEIALKYNCGADWGVLLTGVIIDLRTSLILGNDIEIAVKKADDRDDETDEFGMAFIEEFMRYNNLGDYQSFDMIKSTEIEARLLLKLELDEEHEWKYNGNQQKGMIAVVPYLYLDNSYTVAVNRFKKPIEINFTAPKKGGEKITDFTDTSEFVYRKFGGLVNAYNEPVMRIWRCLTNIEYVDKAIRDLRKINNIFAAPKPYIKVGPEDVEATEENVNENWKAATLLVLSGELKYLQPVIQHVHMLIKEAYFNIQEVGSATGLPVHWLSLVDLMSNRSTAEDLGDITEMAVSTERKIIFDAFTEMLRKSIDMYNKFTKKTPIRKDIFELKANIITDEHWKRLKEFYLEAVKMNKFPVYEFLKLIPDINADEVYKALLEEINESKKYLFPEPDESESEDEEPEAGEEET